MKINNVLNLRGGLFLGLLLLALAIATMGCNTASTTTGSDRDESPQEDSDDTEANVEKVDGLSEECRKLSPPRVEGAKDSERKLVVIQTTRGTIKFKFYPDEAPLHVANFIQLTNCGMYSGTSFHRIGPEDPQAPEMAQGGDPLSKVLPPGDTRIGTGGPLYNVPAEFSDLPHVEGTIAMARSQHKDSASGQFYIAKGPLPFLDGQYTVFGQVTEGLDVLAQLKIGDVMESVTIEEAP